MTTPVPYDPTSVVPDASWLLLNSRGGVRYILVDTHLLQMIKSHEPWHKDVNPRYVDPDDADRTWSAKRAALDGNGKSVSLHRWLLKAVDISTGENLAPGLIADHRNRRRWDCRVANLCLTSHSESNDNRSTRKGKDPRDRGITRWTNKSGRPYWKIQLKRNNRFYHNKVYRQDRYTIDEVRAIRDAAYEAEWGRPAPR